MGSINVTCGRKVYRGGSDLEGIRAKCPNVFVFLKEKQKEKKKR